MGVLEYAHNMSGAVITGAFCDVLRGGILCSRRIRFSSMANFPARGRDCRAGSCITQIFPTGDLQGRYMAKHQPAAVAAMEGLFVTGKGAPS